MNQTLASVLRQQLLELVPGPGRSTYDWSRLTTPEVRELRDLRHKIAAPDLPKGYDLTRLSDAGLDRLHDLVAKVELEPHEALVTAWRS